MQVVVYLLLGNKKKEGKQAIKGESFVGYALLALSIGLKKKREKGP